MAWVIDTRKEDEQDGPERSYTGGTTRAAAGIVQVGYVEIQSGILRRSEYTTMW